MKNIIKTTKNRVKEISRNFNVRGLVNFQNIVLLSVALSAAVLMATFSGCRGDDPLPPDPPKPPVVAIDSIYFNLGTAADIEKNAADITQKIAANNPSKSRIFIKLTANVGINSTQKPLMNNFVEWSQDAIAKGVTIDAGKFFVFPTEKIILTADDISWIRIITIGANPNNGMLFYVSSIDDLLAFNAAGLDKFVQLDAGTGGEYGDAVVVVCGRESDFSAKIDTVKATLAKGDKVAFIVSGLYNLDNTNTTALEPLMGQPKLLIDSKNAIVMPATDSVYVGHPAEFAADFENINKSQYDGGKYFYVPGTATGKAALADKAGVVKTDTLNASSGNMEHGLMPRIWNIDVDLYDCSNILADISKYPNAIVVNGTDYSAAPGGKNRVNNLNPNLYSTPESRKLGNAARLQFTYDPVIGPYHYQEQNFTDMATGNRIQIDDKNVYSYDFLYGNYLGNKMNISNKVADEWAKSNTGGREIFPTLARIEGQPITYAINFPTDDPTYTWNVLTTIYGNPNGYSMVSLETLQNTVIKQTFKLYDRDGNNNDTGNYFFYVNLANVNPVMADSITEEAKKQTDSYKYLGMQMGGYPWLLPYSGVVIAQSVADAQHKKTY